MLLFETHHTSPLWLLKEPGCLTVSACLAHTVILSVQRGTQEILCHEKEQWSEIKAIYPHISTRTMCYARACEKVLPHYTQHSCLGFFFLSITRQCHLKLPWISLIWGMILIKNHNKSHAVYHCIFLLKNPSLMANSSKIKQIQTTFLIIAANSSNDEWKLIGKITRNH